MYLKGRCKYFNSKSIVWEDIVESALGHLKTITKSTQPNKFRFNWVFSWCQVPIGWLCQIITNIPFEMNCMLLALTLKSHRVFWNFRCHKAGINSSRVETSHGFHTAMDFKYLQIMNKPLEEVLKIRILSGSEYFCHFHRHQKLINRSIFFA